MVVKVQNSQVFWLHIHIHKIMDGTKRLTLLRIRAQGNHASANARST